MGRYKGMIAVHAVLAVVLAAMGGAMLQLKLLQGQSLMGAWPPLFMALLIVFMHALFLKGRSRAAGQQENPPPPLPAPVRLTMVLTLLGLSLMAVVAGAATESWMDAPQTGRAILAAVGLAGALLGAIGYFRMLLAPSHPQGD